MQGGEKKWPKGSFQKLSQRIINTQSMVAARGEAKNLGCGTQHSQGQPSDPPPD